MSARGFRRILAALGMAAMVGFRDATGLAPPPPRLVTEEVEWLLAFVALLIPGGLSSSTALFLPHLRAAAGIHGVGLALLVPDPLGAANARVAALGGSPDLTAGGLAAVLAVGTATVALMVAYWSRAQRVEAVFGTRGLGLLGNGASR